MLLLIINIIINYMLYKAYVLIYAHAANCMYIVYYYHKCNIVHTYVYSGNCNIYLLLLFNYLFVCNSFVHFEVLPYP